MGDADPDDADHAQGREPVELAQADVARRGDGRCGHGGEQHRHRGDRDQHRDQDEQREALRVGEVEQELAGGQAAHLDHHVEREQPAAGLVGGAAVEPALGDDEGAGEAVAGEQAHEEPGHGLDEQRMEQHRGRAEREQGREHPHVADPGDELRGRERAEQEADIVARHDDAGDGAREVLDAGAHPEQRALQPVAEHQDRDPDEQRPGRPQCVDHRLRPEAGRRPASPPSV
jgi:hypothetical protein